MKTCPGCNTSKSLSEFRENKSKKDGVQGYCILCDKQKQAIWYQKNKEKCVAKAHTRNKENREENRQYIIEHLKQNPCVVCGEKDIVVLEFDHLRDKKCNVSKLVGGYSLELVKEEVSKCQVLCANCHKRKTAKDYNWYKSD